MNQAPSPASLPRPRFFGPPPGFSTPPPPPPPPPPPGFSTPPPGFDVPPPPLLVRQRCYCERCSGWDYETKEDDFLNPVWTTKQIHSGQF